MSGLIPWGSAPAFEPGNTMALLYALTDDDVTPTQGRDYVDIAQSTRSILLDAPPRATNPAAEWSVPFVAALVFGGAGGAIFLWRRRA